MLKLANPLHTHTGLALALMHTRLLGNHSTTQAVGEDGSAQEQRNEPESEHIHMAGFPGAWKMEVWEMERIQDMVQSLKREHFVTDVSIWHDCHPVK